MTKTNERIERIAKLEARIELLGNGLADSHLVGCLEAASEWCAAARRSETLGHVNKAAAAEEAAYRKIGFVAEEIGRHPVATMYPVRALGR